MAGFLRKVLGSSESPVDHAFAGEPSPLPQRLQRLKSLKVHDDVKNAAEMLLTYCHTHHNDNNVKELSNTLKELFTELVEGRRKTSSGHVVMIHTVTTGRTFGADEALLSQVENCEQLRVQRTDPQRSHIIILFCPITLRIGSDVEAAMNKMSADQPVILVLMHHTRKVDYSTPGTEWSDIYRKVVLDVDVLFHESVSGLLKCPKNQEAVYKIQQKLLRCSDRQQESGKSRDNQESWKSRDNQESWKSRDNQESGKSKLRVMEIQGQPEVMEIQGQPEVMEIQGQPGVMEIQGQPGVREIQGQPVSDGQNFLGTDYNPADDVSRGSTGV